MAELPFIDITKNTDSEFYIISFLFFLALILLFFFYKKLFHFLKKIASRTNTKLDDYILNLFRLPLLFLLTWIPLKFYIFAFLKDFRIYEPLRHIFSLLLIFIITWIVVQLVKSIAFFVQQKLDIHSSNNLAARKSLTQINVFQHIIITVVIIISLSAALLTFKEARTIGISLLTSAGILGIIIGFAAQKSLGMILAGIQLAITQPIRLDDVVIVEGEWGRIEEITLTYVVVKIWDERRLVLPVSYFLEKPFQNWTRTNSEITGTIFLYVDYGFPVDFVRQNLPEILKTSTDFDGRIMNVQVTNTTDKYKEIRILVSSSDASKNWDLRTHIREKMIEKINQEFPEAFARIRVKQV